MSTGVGPFTLSTGISGTGGSTHSGPGTARHRAVNLADLQCEAAAAERGDAIRHVMGLEQALLTLHLEDFPTATRPLLTEPTAPDVGAIIETRKRQALQGISLLDRSKRKEAQQRAEDAARSEVHLQWQHTMQAHVEQQSLLDEGWNKLIAHDAQAVHEALEDAFEDNQSPAACLDVGKDTSSGTGERFATVLIVFGSVDLVPDRRPATTAGGQPTLRKRTKSERNEFYVRALGSTVLATVKEAFAVAPSLTETRIVVLRKDGHAATPAHYVEWIYAARFNRAWTAALPWQSLDTAEILLQAVDAKMLRRGAAGNVAGLPIDDEPGLAAIVEAVRAAI